MGEGLIAIEIEMLASGAALALVQLNVAVDPAVVDAAAGGTEASKEFGADDAIESASERVPPFVRV